MLRRHLLIGLILVQAALFASSPARGNASTVLVLGDSLSAGYGVTTGRGWVDLLGEALAARGEYRVVNASISGETTEGGMARLPALLEEHDPAIVVIELGGNDGLRGFPLAVTRANLTRMIEAAQASGARVLLIGMRIPPNYGPRYTTAFHALFGELAGELGTALVPFLLEDVALEPELMQEDGIHPRTEAQPRLLARVMPVLETLLGP